LNLNDLLATSRTGTICSGSSRRVSSDEAADPASSAHQQQFTDRSNSPITYQTLQVTNTKKNVVCLMTGRADQPFIGKFRPISKDLARGMAVGGLVKESPTSFQWNLMEISAGSSASVLTATYCFRLWNIPARNVACRTSTWLLVPNSPTEGHQSRDQVRPRRIRVVKWEKPGHHKKTNIHHIVLFVWWRVRAACSRLDRFNSK